MLEILRRPCIICNVDPSNFSERVHNCVGCLRARDYHIQYLMLKDVIKDLEDRARKSDYASSPLHSSEYYKLMIIADEYEQLLE